MNKLQKWLIWAWINKQVKEGNKMWIIIVQIGAFIVKNMALIVGILESIVKAITGVISLTPTKQDDRLLPTIDTIFSKIKQILYNISDFMAGKYN